jgi:hypothetical protein
LARAVQLSPDNSDYAFVYAVGLYATGEVESAFSVLEKARARFPTNVQIQNAIKAYCADQREKETPTGARKALSVCSLAEGKG